MAQPMGRMVSQDRVYGTVEEIRDGTDFAAPHVIFMAASLLDVKRLRSVPEWAVSAAVRRG